MGGVQSRGIKLLAQRHKIFSERKVVGAKTSWLIHEYVKACQAKMLDMSNMSDDDRLSWVEYKLRGYDSKDLNNALVAAKSLIDTSRHPKFN